MKARSHGRLLGDGMGTVHTTNLPTGIFDCLRSSVIRGFEKGLAGGGWLAKSVGGEFYRQDWASTPPTSTSPLPVLAFEKWMPEVFVFLYGQFLTTIYP